jgi:hypothetical protein
MAYIENLDFGHAHGHVTKVQNLNCKNLSLTRKYVVFHDKGSSQGPNPGLLGYGSQIQNRLIEHQIATKVY